MELKDEINVRGECDSRMSRTASRSTNAQCRLIDFRTGLLIGLVEIAENSAAVPLNNDAMRRAASKWSRHSRELWNRSMGLGASVSYLGPNKSDSKVWSAGHDVKELNEAGP